MDARALQPCGENEEADKAAGNVYEEILTNNAWICGTQSGAQQRKIKY